MACTTHAAASSSRARRLRNTAVKQRMFLEGCKANDCNPTIQMFMSLARKLDAVESKLDCKLEYLVSCCLQPLHTYPSTEQVFQADSLLACLDPQAAEFTPKHYPESVDFGVGSLGAEASVVSVVDANVLLSSHADKPVYTNWVAQPRSSIFMAGSAMRSQLEHEAATVLQRAFRTYLHGESEVDSMADTDGHDSTSDMDMELDKDALQVVWLSLDKWRQATSFTNLDYESIVENFMGEEKGYQHYGHGKWYKIIPHSSEPQPSPQACAALGPKPAASSSGASAGGEELWNESDVIRHIMMSASVRAAMDEKTRSLDRELVFQLLEEVKHKVSTELYNKAWQTFDESL